MSDRSKTVVKLEGALAWIKENAPAKKDQTLSLQGLKAAFDEFDTQRGKKTQRLIIQTDYLQDFLAFRTKQRSEQKNRQRNLKKNNR
ncbi:MAG: hypothetical protein WDN28_30430 [Chthoniobacter sp.]